MQTFSKIALAALLPLAMQAACATEWPPSEYGVNDEIGAANLLTPQVVMQAVGLVKTGKTYPLAVPVDKNLPAYRHRSFRLYNVQVGQQAGKSLGPNKFTGREPAEAQPAAPSLPGAASRGFGNTRCPVTPPILCLQPSRQAAGSGAAVGLGSLLPVGLAPTRRWHSFPGTAPRRRPKEVGAT